ncbi:hypothetical protein OMR58_25685 [Erwinia sp. INIA-01]|nr:hypothetical protein [Erwinia sp. INIA01]
MHSGEIYQAQAARFSGGFAAGFTRQAQYSRRTRPERCGQEMLCSIRPCGRYKKGRLWATSSGTSFCDHPLFVQLSGHVNDVITIYAGDFVLIATLLCLL